MTAAEIRVTRWGEMLDMIACNAISNGAKPKKKKKKVTMEEIVFGEKADF